MTTSAFCRLWPRLWYWWQSRSTVEMNELTYTADKLVTQRRRTPKSKLGLQRTPAATT